MSKKTDALILDADAVNIKGGTRNRLDASETTFFKRQLEYIKPRTYDIKYKNLRAMELIPVSTEANAGADYIIWYSYGRAGIAKIVADYAHDFPRCDVFATENQSKIYEMGTSYGYSIKEIRRAAKAGNSLDTRRANTARRAIDELFDKLAWFGSEDFNIQGFLNYPGIGDYVVPNGAGGDPEWPTKTPDEIVKDLTGLLDTVSVPTEGREMADTILLPRVRYNLLKNTRMGGSSDTTILKYFLDNNPDVTIEVLDELKDQGDGGSQVMYAYTRDAEHLTMEMVSPFEQLEPDKKGASWEIPCMASYGGVIVYYPQSIAKADNI